MKNILILLILGCMGCSTQKNTSLKKTIGVNWVENETLSETIDQAVQEKKLVLIDFFATWCAPCKMMDEDVFSEKSIGDFYNANFVNLKVNAEKGNGPSLVFLYGVSSYPTYIIVDDKGKVIRRKEGSASLSEMLSWAESAVQNPLP